MHKVEDLGTFSPMEWNSPCSNMEIILKINNTEKMKQETITKTSMEVERQEKLDFKRDLYFGHWPKMEGMLGIV